MPNKKTSPAVAKTASRAIRKSKSKSVRQLAGSALAQARTSKRTSEKLETLAGRVLNDPKSSELAKRLAGSVLGQAVDLRQYDPKYKLS